MARQRGLRFPEGFLWGTASSSYQCEGGNTKNQWYRWEQRGQIRTGERCGEAVNWWKRAESDFALAEQMGNNALRLSLDLHWSLVDNFEWTEGWGVRFGLIEVNPLTQERIARRSAGLFGEICRANAITEDIVECYAPEAMDVVFR
jgi:beta-glucosidase/6-phospho-beta-glucosidase/beta-galactosidase